jgi:hypothetical protein
MAHFSNDCALPFFNYRYLWLELVLRPLVAKWCIVFVITMCLKLREEVKILLIFINLIKDGYKVAFENLSLWVFNIKKKAFGVLKSFLSFLRKYESTKTHNMFFLCYLIFKSLCLIFFLLVVKRVWLLLKNMIGDPYMIPCLSNAIIIYILCQKFKLIVQTK